MLCDAGKYSSGGDCLPCPAGTYKSTVGAGACVACPASTPYSQAGSVFSDACTPCATSACDGTYGKLACPDTDWTVYVDAVGGGQETVNSCVALYTADKWNWTASQSQCAAAYPGAKLLTIRQVWYGWLVSM